MKAGATAGSTTATPATTVSAMAPTIAVSVCQGRRRRAKAATNTHRNMLAAPTAPRTGLTPRINQSCEMATAAGRLAAIAMQAITCDMRHALGVGCVGPRKRL